jgi:uncharacterized protein involved in outer membrane biogenesis
MNNALLYFGGFLITALAVLFAVPHFVDWNSYRGVFEEEATRVLGREVRVGGAVNLRLLPAPYVSFEKLRIADSSDDGGNSIIRVDSFTMWLSVPPLLRGVFEAHRVELRRPIVHLAINSDGNGNWRTLALNPGSIPFAPKDVALQSVEINDGAIIVNGPARGELARFESINGELTAEALDGPFKFKGDVTWDGAPRHVKIATAKTDPNGDLRFKAAVDVEGSGNSYSFDGRIGDVTGKPRLEGDLVAKLALGPGGVAAADPVVEPPPAHAADTPPAQGLPAPSAQGPPGEAQVPAAPGSAANGPPPATVTAPGASNGASGLELRSKVKGTAFGVELADIAVSLEAGTTPQLITGQAKLDWTDTPRLDVELASRWLDLDQLGRGREPKTPLEAGRNYFEVLGAMLPAEADTNARLEFDQVTLGGEPISNVRLAASRAHGPLQLKGVRADLPGGVRLELDGILKPGKAPRLDGNLFVSGKSLVRFLSWALSDPDVARNRNDGPFSLGGRFGLGEDSIALSDAKVEFSGMPLTGGLKLDLGARKKLAVAIEGQRLDAAQIGSGVVGLGAFRTALFGSEPAPDNGTGEGAKSRSTLLDPKTADLSLQLKVAELVDGDKVLRDVDTDVRLEHGSLSISNLKFSTPEGLKVEAEGEATNVPAQPKGAIRGLVTIPNVNAARAFLALLDLDRDVDRLASLAPLRVAGTLELDGGASNASELRLDGTLGGGRLTAAVRLDGGRSRWRTSPLDFEATLDNPDMAGVVAALFDAKIKTEAAKGDPGAEAKSGHAVVKATGIPERGLLSLADVTSEGLSLSYRGQVKLPAAGSTQLDGTLQVAASDARVALALAGLSAGEGVAGIPVGGAVRVSGDATALKLAGEGIRIGDSTIGGEVAITAQDAVRRTVKATLNTDKATFASLLAPTLGRMNAQAVLDAALGPQGARALTPTAPTPPAQRPQPNAAPAADGTAIIWPEQAFDLSFLERVGGTVDLRIGALAIEPGLTVGNARLEAELTPQGIKIARLEGDAVGGRLTSNLNLEKAPAGVGLSGTVRIDLSSKPIAQSSGAAPTPGDVVAFGVDFSSRALSPAAAIAALTGKGEVSIGDATLNGNSPAAVSAVARAALTGQGPAGGNGLVDAIKASLKQGEVKLGTVTSPVQISDGALKLDKVRIDMNGGRSTFATAVELATMKIDSEWQIEPKLDTAAAANPARALLPAVTVVYTGKLSQLAAIEPTVSAGALERELVVRKMELDVGELERLRKLDQDRARQDAERRKALEDDRNEPPQGAPQDGPPGASAPAAPTPGATAAPAMPVVPPQSGAAAGTPPNQAGLAGDGAAGQAAGADPAIEADGTVAPPTVAPSPASEQRPPPRRRRPAEEEWRPFQTPY